ncbi:hypothetical protein JCM11491_003320 [Sporobolomyces phaffii]
MKRSAPGSASTSKKTKHEAPSLLTMVTVSATDAGREYKLVRVIPALNDDEEEEEVEDDEDDDEEERDPEVDEECEWLRRVRYNIVGPNAKVVGHLRFWLIEIEAIRDRFYAEMDIPSSECVQFAMTLFDSSGYLRPEFKRLATGPRAAASWGSEIDQQPLLAYLDEIEIVASERGKGIGTWALQQIWRSKDGLDVEGLEDIEFLFACPAPLPGGSDGDFVLSRPSEAQQAARVAAFAANRPKIVSFFRKASLVLHCGPHVPHSLGSTDATLTLTREDTGSGEIHLAGTRHRRTQSASVSQARHPIEIVVTSPGSESFPLSPLDPPARPNLFPPPSQSYSRPEQDDEATARRSRRGRDGPGPVRVLLLVGLVLVTLAELLQYGNGRLAQYREKERILREQDEVRRNFERRKIASTLFPSTTFYPRPPSRTPSPAASSSVLSLSPTRGYLFPVRIAEQESKATQHLHQLALLAISLNRTLVLPNVGGSRLHSCHLFPFAFHYDVEAWLDRFEGKLAAVSQEEWLEATELHQKSYSAHSINLMEGKKAAVRSIEDDEDARESPRNQLDLAQYCLAHASGSFDTDSPVTSTFYAPLRYRESDDLALAGFSNGLVSSLSRFSSSDTRIPSTSASAPIPSTSTIPVDVLFVDYNLRYPIFPSFLPNSTDLTPVDSDSDEEPVSETSQQSNNVALYEPWPALRALASSPTGSPSTFSFLPFRPLPYAPLWTELAANIARDIKPYAGVHWRMENVPPSDLSPCAVALSETLDSLAVEPDPPRTIYLASDYSFDSILLRDSERPHPGTAPQALSDTFTNLSRAHRAAAHRLVRLLRSSSRRQRSLLSYLWPSSSSTRSTRPDKIRTLATLATILDPMASSPSRSSSESRDEPNDGTTVFPRRLVDALAPFDGDLFALDAGVRAIVDKLVLGRAAYFVAGFAPAGGRGANSGACAKRSSFTESVVSERQTRRESGPARADESEDEAGRAGHRETETGVARAGDDEVDRDLVRWFRRPT